MTWRADAQPPAENKLRVTGRLWHEVAAGLTVSQAANDVELG
jgi:hypothetical protein